MRQRPRDFALQVKCEEVVHNVAYLESVWLIDEALKKGKGELLSYMMYPGEFHYFTRAGGRNFLLILAMMT